MKIAPPMFVFAYKWNIRVQVQFYIRLYFEIDVTMETKALIIIAYTPQYLVYIILIRKGIRTLIQEGWNGTLLT